MWSYGHRRQWCFIFGGDAAWRLDLYWWIWHHREKGGALNGTLNKQPIYTLYSGYLLKFIGYISLLNGPFDIIEAQWENSQVVPLASFLILFFKGEIDSSIHLIWLPSFPWVLSYDPRVRIHTIMFLFNGSFSIDRIHWICSNPKKAKTTGHLTMILPGVFNSLAFFPTMNPPKWWMMIWCLGQWSLENLMDLTCRSIFPIFNPEISSTSCSL